MGLTRTKFSQANTSIAKIADPITTLNNDSNVANTDVGFIFNRNQGIKSNAAFYWNETGTEFTTALTSNTGITDSNIAVVSYADLRIGSLYGNIGGGNDQANVFLTGSIIPTANVQFDLGTSTNRFRSLWISGTTIYIGKETMSVDGAGTWSFTSGGNTVNLGAGAAFNPSSITTGNLTVTSNLTVQGTQFVANTTDVSFVDSALELHTLPNLAPLTSDDGRDIGLKLHYFKGKDEHAFIGWVNASGYLEWMDSGREGPGNTFVGNTYGTIKSGAAWLVNTTPSTSTTSGALRVAGGVGIGGALYIANTGDVSANIGSYQLFANANAATQATSLNNINANIGSYQIFANANLSTRTIDIANIVTNANTNTAAYIATHTGNVSAANVVVSDKIYTTNGLYWLGNGQAFSSGGGGTPGGSFNQIQFNNAGSFGGVPLLFNSGTGNIVGTTTTVSTSISTGALVLMGGLGVAGNIFAGGLNGTHYGSLYIGTTDVNLNRSSGAQTLTGVGIDGTATTATNAINTQVTSNISSGTAYVTFVNAGSGNVAQNINTSLTYNPNSGNLRAFGIQTDTGVYWAGNGAAFSTPAGTTGQLQYNNASTFAGANIVFNNANGNLVITSTTTSTSTTTGALVVAGGAGFSGNIFTSGWIIPSGNVAQNLGSATSWWNLVYGRSVQAQYADLAENYQADQEYAPGTVLIFGGECEVTTTNVTHDTRVAGVVSTNPAYLMNAMQGNVSIAFTGRVPCLVRGPVDKGTVLVTSDLAGTAEAINSSMFRPGCVLGKSLEQITDSSIKLIEVVVGRF